MTTSVWGDVTDPTLQAALAALEAAEKLGAKIQLTPQMARAIRNYIIALKARGQQ